MRHLRRVRAVQLLASLYNEMLSFALPLWLALRAHAPLWLVSATLLINTMGCVLFQVWAVIGAGGPGWLALGAIFVVAGLAYPWLVGWGIRTRAVAVPA